MSDSGQFSLFYAFYNRDIATRAGEGLVHCLQATCSPLQEFLHSQSDCRILPRDVIPPTLLGAASSWAWFGLSFWLPTAQSKRLGLSLLELKTQSLSLEDTGFFFNRWTEKCCIFTQPLLALESKVKSLSWRLVKDRAFLGAEVTLSFFTVHRSDLPACRLP